VGTLYWAYGRNLSEAAMRDRCPRAVKLGPLTIRDSQLVFRGVADVVLKKGWETPGGLWWISGQCEETLDAYEGARSRFYLKRYFPSVKAYGKKHKCLFYQMQASQGIMPPTQEYYEAIRQGYADFGLDLGALQEALDRSYEDKKITPLLRQRHIRKGRPDLAKPSHFQEGTSCGTDH